MYFYWLVHSTFPTIHQYDMSACTNISYWRTYRRLDDRVKKKYAQVIINSHKHILVLKIKKKHLYT